jgi:DNA-binding MarR family transcriptional regulator
MVISLTDAARELLAEYDEPVQALEERMLSALTARQRDSLRSSLNACRAALADQPAP